MNEFVRDLRRAFYWCLGVVFSAGFGLGVVLFVIWLVAR